MLQAFLQAFQATALHFYCIVKDRFNSDTDLFPYFNLKQESYLKLALWTGAEIGSSEVPAVKLSEVPAG